MKSTSELLRLTQSLVDRLIRIAAQDRQLRKRGPKAEWTIEVVFASQPKMRSLNRAYLKKNRPTDVLSFPSAEPFWSQGIIGQLVICLPVARSQAKSCGHSIETELAVLAVHGLLHLLGMDHEKSAKDRQAMARWENKLLAQIGKTRAHGLADPRRF